MVTKKKNVGQNTAKNRRVKVGKLKVKKETLKNLDPKDGQKIKGGGKPISDRCITRICPTFACDIIISS